MNHRKLPLTVNLLFGASVVFGGCSMGGARREARPVTDAGQRSCFEPVPRRSAVSDAAVEADQLGCPTYDETRRWTPEQWTREQYPDIRGWNIPDPVVREVLELDRLLPTHAQIWLRAVHLHVAAALLQCEAQTGGSARIAQISLIVRPDGTGLVASVRNDLGDVYEHPVDDGGVYMIPSFHRCVFDRLGRTKTCTHRANVPLLAHFTLVRSSNPWR
jgi:hypothetical protein